MTKSKLIDTHAHINMLKDPEGALKEALEADVGEIIVPTASVDDIHDILELSKKYENIYTAFGVHPEYADSFTNETAKKIIDAANDEKCRAIGEIGLDYHYSKENKKTQQNVFITQLEIAKMLDKPVVVHSRDASLDTLNILKELNPKKVLLHCFSGSVEFMRQCIDLGYKIALGGVVTFKNAVNIKEVARLVPLEDLMLETDCPYLAPHPFRGEENSPKYIGFVAKEIANLKNISYVDVVSKTTENAKMFFDIK